MLQKKAGTTALPMYQVDAFTDRLFGGNPAAVIPLKKWLPDPVMQKIAAENNLSETAFFVPLPRARGGDKAPRFHLRWFTPAVEVALCGHATLASGWVILKHIVPDAARVVFDSRSGPLSVARRRMAGHGALLELDFPAIASKPAPAVLLKRAAAALGVRPLELWQSDRLMAVLKDAKAVRQTTPDFAKLKALPGKGCIVTAEANAAERPADFVSRFFAPYAGVNEDPVTGSAHCVLMPYWAKRLGKTRLHASQISARVGELICELRGDRVGIAGQVAPYLEGTIRVPL